jgi:endonuclease YncB( thermonuclease family)
MRFLPVICTLAGLAAAATAHADWIVYVRGGIQETKGPWEVKGRQVQFHGLNGTLLSARAEDVDLPASAFLTWQVGDRRRAPVSRPVGSTGAAEPRPCSPAKVMRSVSAETYELAIDGRRELVHLACLDTPETRHRFPDLAWYGHQTASVVGGLLRPEQSVCFVEEEPPQRDRDQHRIVYLRLGDGRDLGAEVISRGLGVARAGECGRGESYRVLEEQARLSDRGHWGPEGNAASVAIVSQSLAFHAAPAPRSGGGSA